MAENVISAVAGIVANFNAIHNVFRSAWLMWFINDLQVLVPFLCAPVEQSTNNQRLEL